MRLLPLLAWLLVTTTACTPAGPKPAPQPTPAPPALTGASRVTFVDDTHGWLITPDVPASLARTADAGRTWTSVTPPERLAGAFSAASFPNASTAYLAYTGAEQPAVLHTSDGGQSWQTNTFPMKDASGAALSFPDATHGWLLLHTRVGMNHDWAELFRTEDGGASWTRLTPDLTQSGPQNLPYAGGKTGLTFTGTGTGWAGTGPVAKGTASLYRTTDGGQNWQPQPLVLPAGAASADVTVLAPRFFSAADGVLPVTWYTEGQSFFASYITHDAGQTWAPRPLLATGFAGPIGAYFTSTDAGWVWTALADSSVWGPVFHTADGGRSWQPTQPPVYGEVILQFEFVSPRSGWALVKAGRDGPVRLLLTRDGGVTWQGILPAKEG